ncbi:hypothetical protein QOZ80_3BG0274840 [Eleusine coracana subsp. coracana]|nr:hypothetical protein QOZ80_3BG0274840 [Eleusine coracana subsp. coracana]
MADQSKGGLEGAMKGLQLSVVEKKDIKLGKKTVGSSSTEDDWHTVGKALSEKLILVEGISQTLGRIWCSDRGMICKEMGNNLLLFHFNHPAEVRRALKDGLWTAGHNLLVMAPSDGR